MCAHGALNVSQNPIAAVFHDFSAYFSTALCHRSVCLCFLKRHAGGFSFFLLFFHVPLAAAITALLLKKFCGAVYKYVNCIQQVAERVQAHTTHTQSGAQSFCSAERKAIREHLHLLQARSSWSQERSAARRSATPTNTMRRQFCGGELAVKSWKTSRLILLVSFPALLSKEEKRRREEKLLRHYWNSSAPISLGTNG